jgi:hypothetical protein
MAFLEVITRTYKRPELLVANQASLDAQSDDDWIQTVYVDDDGHGVGWANGQMFHYAQVLRGDYIWILDDDDICTRASLVAELKMIVREFEPDVIMLRMDHGERGILPPVGLHFPTKGLIGCSAYVVSQEVWKRHAYQWQSANYSSDYDFINSILNDKHVSVHWHDVIASKVQRISLGEPA